MQAQHVRLQLEVARMRAAHQARLEQVAQLMQRAMEVVSGSLRIELGPENVLRLLAMPGVARRQCEKLQQSGRAVPTHQFRHLTLADGDGEADEELDAESMRLHCTVRSSCAPGTTTRIHRSAPRNPVGGAGDATSDVRVVTEGVP